MRLTSAAAAAATSTRITVIIAAATATTATTASAAIVTTVIAAARDFAPFLARCAMVKSADRALEPGRTNVDGKAIRVERMTTFKMRRALALEDLQA